MLRQMKVNILNIAKKHHFVLWLIRNANFLKGRLKYLYFYIFNKTNNEMIIFEAYMGRSFSCSPKAIYMELLKDKKYKNYKFIWAFKEPEKYKFLKRKRNTAIIKYASSKYYRYYSKAKYWITNSRLPEVIKKRKNQVYVQCWHGTPLKKLGYDISVVGGNAMNSINDIRKKYKNDSKRYNYIISPSHFCTNKFISAFNLQRKNIIKEIGYPRDDYLINYAVKDVNRIKSKLKIPLDKKIILYAPTWRDNEHESGIGYTYQLNLDFNKLREKYSEKYIILFKSHYFISNYIDLSKYKGFVYNVSDYSDINDLYIISDLLITDYSSVFFDYANLKKPIIFYMYDLDEYKTKLRDFYIDLSELPGPIARTQKKLQKEIDGIESYEKRYLKKYEKFNKKYNYLNDGKSSKRFIKEIIK